MSNWKDDIAVELKKEAAALPPNSRFHPIRKLMTRFNTSQRTIEQVMQKLIAENVVIRRPGDGYFTRNLSPAPAAALSAAVSEVAERIVQAVRGGMADLCGSQRRIPVQQPDAGPQR